MKTIILHDYHPIAKGIRNVDKCARCGCYRYQFENGEVKYARPLPNDDWNPAEPKCEPKK